MNSLTLKENGFANFIPLKGLTFSSLPSNQSSIIVLTDSSLAGKPTSDILYIGKTKKIAKRVFGGYLAGYGGKTTRKINSMLLNDGFLEKVSIGWSPSDNPKAKQQELLENFKKEHGQYPSWNATKKATKKTPPEPKTAKPAPTVRKRPKEAL